MTRLLVVLAVLVVGCGGVGDGSGDGGTDAGTTCSRAECVVDADCVLTRVPSPGACATLCPPVAVSILNVPTPGDNCPVYDCALLRKFRYTAYCDAAQTCQVLRTVLPQ